MTLLLCFIRKLGWGRGRERTLKPEIGLLSSPSQERVRTTNKKYDVNKQKNRSFSVSIAVPRTQVSQTQLSRVQLSGTSVPGL